MKERTKNKCTRKHENETELEKRIEWNKIFGM